MPTETIYYASLFLLGTVITFGVMHENRTRAAQLMPPFRGLFRFVCFVSGIGNLVLLVWGFLQFGWYVASIGLVWSLVFGTIHGRMYADLFGLFSLVYGPLGLGLGIYAYVSLQVPTLL